MDHTTDIPRAVWRIRKLVFGAGLVLSNPTVQKSVSQFGIGGLAQGALPDFERYLRLRNM